MRTIEIELKGKRYWITEDMGILEQVWETGNWGGLVPTKDLSKDDIDKEVFEEWKNKK